MTWQVHDICYCSVAKLWLTLCDPMDCSTPGFPVLHHLPEFAQTHVHWVGDAIQLSLPLSSPSPPAFSLSHHQDLFQWVGSLHQVAKVLELQLQHQSFQWHGSIYICTVWHSLEIQGPVISLPTSQGCGPNEMTQWLWNWNYFTFHTRLSCWPRWEVEFSSCLYPDPCSRSQFTHLFNRKK